MKLTIGKKIGAGYGVALLIMAGMGAAAYRNTDGLVESANWVAHTHRVMATAQDIVNTLTAAESGVRGYVLTGDERYLREYENAVSLAAKWKTLRALATDDPGHQSRLDAL